MADSFCFFNCLLDGERFRIQGAGFFYAPGRGRERGFRLHFGTESGNSLFWFQVFGSCLELKAGFSSFSSNLSAVGGEMGKSGFHR